MTEKYAANGKNPRVIIAFTLYSTTREPCIIWLIIKSFALPLAMARVASSPITVSLSMLSEEPNECLVSSYPVLYTH